jgi:hypothetical protein
MTTSTRLLIEGYRPEDLPDALGKELQDEILVGRPIVARVGTAEVLMSLHLETATLRAELAHVDGGGEGALPALFSVIVRFARAREADAIEWFVFATNCARPNPRLRPILERRGFVVRDIEGRGACYYRRDDLSKQP